MLFPNDHARTLIEVLKGFGPEGSDLIRRWVAALLLVPESEREVVVSAVETRVSTTYREVRESPGIVGSTVTLRTAPLQGDGFVEETVRVFERLPLNETAKSPPLNGSRNTGKAMGREKDRGAA